MVGIAPQQNLVIDIVKYTFVVASGNHLGYEINQTVFDETLSTLLDLFQDARVPSGFFEALVDIITGIPDEVSFMVQLWPYNVC